MPKLIYVNNKLDLPKIEDQYNIRFNNEFKNYNTISTNVWYELHYPHNRVSGADLWDLHLLPKYQIPKFDPDYNLNFRDITDLRALELEQLHLQTGKPIVVTWSGGIDSTCAVAAIYKNFKPCTRKHVTVLLNNFSYFENPVFFNSIVKPNFKFAQIEKYQSDPWESNIVVSGEPADQIWLHADILEIIHRHTGSSTTDVNCNPDILLKFIGSKSNPEHAKWFYETIMKSANDAPVPISTYEDFYWWANYNFYLAGNSLKAYINDTSVHCPTKFDLFQKYYQPWYLTDHYQQWSMHNNSNGVKINNTVQSYKMPSKDYIFDVDKNWYYRNYKTKTGSFKQYTANEHKLSNVIEKVFAVFDDGSVIKFNDPNWHNMLIGNQRLLK